VRSDASSNDLCWFQARLIKAGFFSGRITRRADAGYVVQIRWHHSVPANPVSRIPYAAHDIVIAKRMIGRLGIHDG